MNVVDWIDKSNQMSRSYDRSCGAIVNSPVIINNILSNVGQCFKRECEFYREQLDFYVISDVRCFWIDKTINFVDCTPASYVQSLNAPYL